MDLAYAKRSVSLFRDARCPLSPRSFGENRKGYAADSILITVRTFTSAGLTTLAGGTENKWLLKDAKIGERIELVRNTSEKG